MRVNIYAEETTQRVEIISKTIDGQVFTGLRFYLELPVTQPDGEQVSGPFIHHPGDDDSSAVTFWGKKDLRALLYKAQDALDAHYGHQIDEYLYALEAAKDLSETHEPRFQAWFEEQLRKKDANNR